MNGHGKSDNCVVPTKPPNKGDHFLRGRDGTPQTGTKAETPDTAKGRPKPAGAEGGSPAEGVEGRRLAEGNLRGQNMHRAQDRESVSSALERVGRVAKGDRDVRFTTLLHHVYNPSMLREAYFGLKRDAAPGVDGQTWREYGEQLDERIVDLSGRLKRGAYRAKSVRRAQIPKLDGGTRVLGVTALEDKIVQRALVEVLNQIYEVDFLGFSYGYRPGRSQHDALDALHVGITRKKVSWVLDADIRGYFDAIDHEWLVKFVEHRVADRRIVRLIQKWLRAGVLEEDGRKIQNEMGTPQGGGISPLLANIYLHYALDLWVDRWRQQAQGDVIIVRYADDFIVGFQYETEARRFWADLRERLARFGLELHPEKTRLLEFGRFADSNRRRGGRGKPESFDFLGFTHICGKKRNGKFVVLRKTSRKRLRRKLREVKTDLRRRMHDPVPEVGKWLGAVLSGHFNYYGVPLNSAALHSFRRHVIWLWRRALSRRSQMDYVTWGRIHRLATRWLPPVRITHPYPSERLRLVT
jgi:RNA-directed DNA polymerase